MNNWRPNWKNLSEYPSIDDMSLNQLAWEFLRRNLNYERDHQEFKYILKVGSLEDPEHREYGESNYFIDNMQHKYAIAINDRMPHPSDNNPPDFQALNSNFLHFNGTYSSPVVQGAIVDSKLILKLNSSLPESRQFKMAKEIFVDCVSRFKNETYDSNFLSMPLLSCRKSEVQVTLDPAIKWDAQIKNVQTCFREHRKVNKYQSEYGIAKHGISQYIKYLRIIDAHHTGAKSREIAEHLYGVREFDPIPVDIRKKMSRDKKQAMRLLKFGFRQIPHMTPIDKYKTKQRENQKYQLSLTNKIS